MTGPSAAIYNHFKNVTDPRVNRGANHSLLEMMFVALTAAICGANGWADVERFGNSKLNWFRRFIELEHGIPSHDTFGRVFSRLDTSEFLTAMHSWVDSFAENLRGQGVAIDGKTLRGSFDRAAGTTALHTITAFATKTRTVLRQMSVDEKSNEIPAVPKLLDLIELAGAVVTLDAMHCQTKRPRPSSIGGRRTSSRSQRAAGILRQSDRVRRHVVPSLASGEVVWHGVSRSRRG